MSSANSVLPLWLNPSDVSGFLEVRGVTPNACLSANHPIRQHEAQATELYETLSGQASQPIYPAEL